MARASSKPAAYSIRSPLEIVTTGQVERAFDHLVAVAPEKIHEIIERSRRSLLLGAKETQGISLKQWLRMYRVPGKVAVATSLSVIQPEGMLHLDEVRESWKYRGAALKADVAKQITRTLLGNITADEIRLTQRRIDLHYRMCHLPWLRKALADELTLPETYGEWLELPEIVFAVSVGLPCVMENHQTPWDLFLEARRGNVEAFEKLLRIDPLVANDASLAAIAFRLAKESPERYELIQKAQNERKPSPLTLRKLKYSLAGLLLHFGKEFERVATGEVLFELLQKHVRPGYETELRRWVKSERKRRERQSRWDKINCGVIRSLFNAVAKDRGLLVDSDFTQQPNTITQRIKRNALAWNTLQKSDIIRAA